MWLQSAAMHMQHWRTTDDSARIGDMMTWMLVTWPTGKRLRLGIEGDSIRVVFSEDLTAGQRTELLGRRADDTMSVWVHDGAKIERVDEHGNPF